MNIPNSCSVIHTLQFEEGNVRRPLLTREDSKVVNNGKEPFPFTHRIQLDFQTLTQMSNSRVLEKCQRIVTCFVKLIIFLISKDLIIR